MPDQTQGNSAGHNVRSIVSRSLLTWGRFVGNENDRETGSWSAPGGSLCVKFPVFGLGLSSKFIAYCTSENACCLDILFLGVVVRVKGFSIIFDRTAIFLLRNH